MRKKLTLAALLFASITQAQYFQHWYNRSLVVANMSQESFYDGIRTRANYGGGNPATYYQVGYGSTMLGPVGALVPDETRFVRTNKGGTVINANTGTRFAKTNTTLWLNSYGKAICEINNGLGTGGYLAVGNVEDNPATGATVAGGSDALFYKMNNAGTTSARYRFDYIGRADYFTDIIASTFSPGTYYICGYTHGATDDMAIVVSIQANGTVNWFRTYQFDPTAPANTASCRAYGIAEDAASGNLMVVGYINDPTLAPNTGNDGLVFSLTSGGAVISAKAHHVFIDDQYHDIKQTAAGNFAIAGFVGDGNLIPAAFYHIWLSEITPFNTMISTQRYDHGIGGAFNQSKGYALVVRQNNLLNWEYYIAGPSFNSAGGMVSAISKISATPGNPAVAWYNYAPQSGMFEGGYGLDFATTAATGPGLRLFSNTNAPAPLAFNNGSYLAKTYFNGATCTNYTPNNPLIFGAIPMTVAILPNVTDTIYKRYPLAAQVQNYVFGSICAQAVVPGGSNARLGSDEDVAEILDANTISLYPNPVEDMLNVSMNLTQGANYNIEAIDITGRAILLADQYISDGQQTVQLDVSNLAKGMYTLVVRSSSQSMTKKFIVQ